MRFNERLLTEPELAQPRPAWERRPRVSLVYALWRTLIDVTFHPRRFFDSIQQPNRLRRSLTWHVTPIVLCWLVVFAYAVSANRFVGITPALWGYSGYPSYLVMLLLGSFWYVLPALCLVLLPLVATLLIADVVLWKNRGPYRLFFKGVLYTNTVYVWLALAICGIGVLLNLASSPMDRFESYVRPLFSIDIRLRPWTNWLLAGAITWQYALIFRYVLGRRFAVLQRPQFQRKTVLLVIVAGAWLTGMYLVFFDTHLGFRFATAQWGSELVQ